LSKEGKEIWNKNNEEFSLDAEAFPVLKTAVENYDRMNAARKLIKKEGFVVSDPSGRKRTHPAVSVEKEARSGFLQSWRLLGLNTEIPGPVGRPPGR
jgi:phage terminase small subunit